MLNLVTGVPGASKTAYVVTELDKLERSNKINLARNKTIHEENKKLIEKYKDDFSYFEVEIGSGHELKTILEYLQDDYFSFLDLDYDDLRPDFYFQRSAQYNEIIERIEDRDGEQGFKQLLPVRTIYSNIKALKIEYCRANVYDWRNCPDGSIIVIDEVQLVEPYSLVKDKNNEIVQELTIHRHRGFDFYFITQAPSLLHPTIKELIGVHFHITRPYGRTPKIYRFGSCRQYPNTLINKINCEAKFSFKPNPRIFKLYKSTTINTHQARFPKGLLGFGAFVLGAFCLFLYGLSGATNSSFISDKKDLSVDTTDKFDTSKNEIIEHKEQVSQHDEKLSELSRIASVFATETTCNAYNGNGDLLDISFQDCITYSNNPKKLRSASYDVVSQRLQAINYSQSSDFQINTTPVVN